VVEKLVELAQNVPVNLDEVTLIILPLFIGKPADVTADRDWSFNLISAMSVSYPAISINVKLAVGVAYPVKPLLKVTVLLALCVRN